MSRSAVTGMDTEYPIPHPAAGRNGPSYSPILPVCQWNPPVRRGTWRNYLPHTDPPMVPNASILPGCGRLSSFQPLPYTRMTRNRVPASRSLPRRNAVLQLLSWLLLVYRFVSDTRGVVGTHAQQTGLCSAAPESVAHRPWRFPGGGEAHAVRAAPTGSPAYGLPYRGGDGLFIGKHFQLFHFLYCLNSICLLISAFSIPLFIIMARSYRFSSSGVGSWSASASPNK